MKKLTKYRKKHPRTIKKLNTKKGIEKVIEHRKRYERKYHKKWCQITELERIIIWLYYSEDYSYRKIGKLLERDHKTIEKEIERNGILIGSGYVRDKYNYYYKDAQSKRRQRVDKTMHNRLKLVKNKEILKRIDDYIDSGKNWSIRGWLGRCAKEGKPIGCSFMTLYRWVFIRGGKYRTLLKHPCGYSKIDKEKAYGQYHSLATVDERPEVINNRERIGDFECDTVVTCRGGTGCLLTMVDRKSRYLKIRLLESGTAEQVYLGMLDVIQSLRKENYPVHSLTIDNGKEFSKIRDFQKMGIELYRCHAYSSYEKGTNERNNREIRVFLPKKSNLGLETMESIQAIENLINNMPRRILDYSTAYEVFTNKEVRYIL